MKLMVMIVDDDTNVNDQFVDDADVDDIFSDDRFNDDTNVNDYFGDDADGAGWCKKQKIAQLGGRGGQRRRTGRREMSGTVNQCIICPTLRCIICRTRRDALFALFAR